MAFLSRKKEEDALKSEQILLDATLMQNLQDRFCDANNLYFRDFALKNKNPCSACEFQAKQGISIWGIKLLFFSV